MQRRRRAGDLADRGCGAIEILGEPLRREPQEIAVPVTVDRHGVARGHDLGRERRVGADLLADEEERRVRAGGREDLERRGRALGVRAVVEGERHAVRARAAQRHAQRAGDGRDDRASAGSDQAAPAARPADSTARALTPPRPSALSTSAAADGRRA